MDFPAPACLQGRPCKLICCNPTCTKTPYVCRTQGCPCDSPHQHCKHLNWHILLQNLKSKMANPNHPVLATVRKFLTDSIADLQAELASFESHIANTFGLTENEQDFLRILKTKRHEMLSGSVVYQLQKDLSAPGLVLPDKRREDLELQFTLWKKQLRTLLDNVKGSYDKGEVLSANKSQKGSTVASRIDRSPLRSIVNDPVPSGKNSQISIDQKPSSFIGQPSEPLPYFNLGSKITNDTKTLMDFFLPKLVKTFKLLFRASEHRFSVAQFHKFCDLIPNTLTIVRTEFGEKIGGFTPLQWNQARDGHYETDQSGNSFLFSLTRKEKMKLVDPARAIANDKKFGPVFGSGHDLAIADMGDRHAHSSSQFPNSYNNGYNKDSGVRLSGGKNSPYFKITQWQVFEVQFEK